MCLNIGTPKNINFSFETNGKLMALGVPILKHIRVFIEDLDQLHLCRLIGKLYVFINSPEMLRNS